ncbi:hypothetical protein EON65_46795, partial [archaeon]
MPIPKPIPIPIPLGKMSRAEIIAMLKVRAKETELTYEQYQKYLDNPTLDSRREMIKQARGKAG